MAERLAPPLGAGDARIDLHAHTRASFDGVAEPVALVRCAAERGLTHIAITDHDTLTGAREAAAADIAGITVLVGCEVLTIEGDLVFVFLGDAIPTGLPAREAIAMGREQGAMIGIPHPFDRTRRSLLRDAHNLPLASLVDWIEGRNGRVGYRAADDAATALARKSGIPAVGVSDAHALIEVGTTYTTLTGDPSTPDGLRAALAGRIGIHDSGLDDQPAAHPRGRLTGWWRLRRGVGR